MNKLIHTQTNKTNIEKKKEFMASTPRTGHRRSTRKHKDALIKATHQVDDAPDYKASRKRWRGKKSKCIVKEKAGLYDCYIFPLSSNVLRYLICRN